MWKFFAHLSKEYFFHVNYDHESVNVMLTDLITSWKETQFKDVVNSRFKGSKSFDGKIEVKKINDLLLSDLDVESAEVSKSITFDEDKCYLNLSSSIKNLSYNFVLTKNTPEEFLRGITLPLILMVKELNVRQDKLKQLLKEKDDEITEYQLEGAKLFRRYLRTEKFNEETFKEECSKRTNSNFTLFLTDSKNLFDGDVGALYLSATKVIQENSLKRDGICVSDPSFSADSKSAEITKRKTKENDLKWDVGPQNTKRFKNHQSKLKF